MHSAAEHGDVKTMRLLLSDKGNADVDARSTELLTPLYLAVKEYHTKAAKLLMDHGADVNAKFKNGETILNLAVSNGLTELVKEILKYHPDKNCAASKNTIKLAAYRNGRKYLEIVQDLMKYGFPINSNDVLILVPKAIEESYVEIIQHILENGLHLACYRVANCNFLHLAVKFHQLEIAKLFLDHGVDVDATDGFGKRAIYYSVKNSDVIMTNFLLSHGASVQKSPELLRVATTVVCKDIVEILLQKKVDIEASDEYGRTALHLNSLSVMKPSSNYEFYNETKGEIAKLLLSMGAKVDAKIEPDGLTAFHIAIANILPNVVKVLFEYKADINCIAANRSPLIFAVETGNTSIIKMLITNGANVNSKMFNGDTALHITARTKCVDALKILLKNGAYVYTKNSCGQTPLHEAVRQSSCETVALLLQHMTLVDLKDEYGKTPLHWALELKKSTYIQLLLDSGSDINIMLNNYTLSDILLDDPRRSPSFDYFDDTDVMSNEMKSNCDIQHTKICRIVIAHLIKLREANLYVHRKNIIFLHKNSHEHGDLLTNCRYEIERLKLERIANNKISLYAILTKSVNSLAIYARNRDIIRFFESGDYKTRYQIYAPFIERNFIRAKRRCFLVEKGQEFFTYYLKLPIYCSDHILMYLSDVDLETIFNSFKMP